MSTITNSIETARAELADVERRIDEHLAAIAELREVGIRLHADAKTSGHDCLKWLTERGMTDGAARVLCVTVRRERIAPVSGREPLMGTE